MPPLTVALLDATANYRRYLEPVLRKLWPHELVIHSSSNRSSDLVFYSGNSEVQKLRGKKILIWTHGTTGPTAGKMADLVLDCRKLVSKHTHLPLYVLHFAERYQNRLDELLVPKQTKEISAKTKFCAYLYTKGNETRESLFRAIHTYKPVDALGKHMHNQSQATLSSSQFVQKRPIIVKPGARHITSPYPPLPIAGSAVLDRELYVRGVKTYLDSAVQKYRPYRFVIVCENTVTPGYTTANLISAMLARCVPIYFGAPDIGSIFNPRAFINASSFPNFSALAQHVAKTNADPQLYESLFLEPWFRDNKLPDIFQQEYLFPALTCLISPSAT